MIALELSGPALHAGLDALAPALADLVELLKLKQALFAELLADGRSSSLTEISFLGLANFMPTVRRRVGLFLDAHGFAALHAPLVALLNGPEPLAERWSTWLASFPSDRAHRWLRDLGAEALHFRTPEATPLMARWIWDATTGTGVLREIWYPDADPPEPVGIDDSLATFLALGHELDAFLRAQGMFRDLALVADLLCAQVYAGYINDRGSTFLKADFAAEEDACRHTRRMMGLDALTPEGLRPRVRLPARLAA
ncbi:MAG: hypothetical protein ACP5NP_07080 [Acetobacteraceae bacterium]